MTNQQIVIISPFFNAENYIQRCIESVAIQDYKNYIHILIDDCSTDNSYSVAKHTMNMLPTKIRKNFHLIKTTENVGAVANQIKTLRNEYYDLPKIDDFSIIMLLDGDDALVNLSSIFAFYDRLYDGTTEFTYGSCWSEIDNIPLISQPFPLEIKQNKLYRNYKHNWGMPYTHLRTFKKYLINNIPDSAFKDENGNWFRAGGDNATFYNIIEQSNPEKVKVVSDIVYLYNDKNPLNDYKVNAEEQTRTANFISTYSPTLKEKYSIIIPTMWRYNNFCEFLKKLTYNDYVGEIIIIDNNKEQRPNEIILSHYKIVIKDFGENIFVNPAWNYGVGIAKYNKICIVNDDIEFNLDLFKSIDSYYDKDFGVIGLCPGEQDFNQPLITTGEINIIPWSGEHTYGFGCLMFVRKDNWIPIPDGLKIYFGDNFIFDLALKNNKPIYLITNMMFDGTFAKTTSDTTITNGFLETEKEIYMKIKDSFNRIETLLNAPPTPNVDFFEEEFKKYCNIPSDINEHLPILNKFAKKCTSVTEFGVREGVSTRAFLATNVKLRSYDIQYFPKVAELFKSAFTAGKDVFYGIGDVLKCEIDETDMLFIDTLHTYDQLEQELKLHAHKVKKYLAFHDTQICGTIGENQQLGLLPAILNFQIEHPEWKTIYHSFRNNGLTILERTQNKPITKKKILIAIPTAKYIESDTFKSIYDLIIPESYDVTYQHFFGYDVAQIRNLVSDWTIKGFDYLFSVDSDIILPKDALVKLLSHDKDVVSGMYIQRIPDTHNLELYGKHGRINYEDIANKGLVEISGCGFGCVLVKKEVFFGVGYPQFEYHSAIDHANTISEDVDFCKKAVEKGFKIWVDTSLKCTHIGNTLFEVKSLLPEIQDSSKEDKIKIQLRKLGNQDLLPKLHVDYLNMMKFKMGKSPKVIYDIGACVLHWTKKAKEVWNDSIFVVFEGMNETKFLYEENHLLHYNGVLSDFDFKMVNFYKNVTYPGGNSYYRENIEINPKAYDYFPENSAELCLTKSLDTVVQENNFPLPNLIKLDVQGAELDILKGASKVLEYCDDLILELQCVEYNKGAPLKSEVIYYLNQRGFYLVGTGPFFNAGPDGDYHFTRKL